VTHPTRATVSGRAYLDVQNLARRTGRPTDELHQLYALEGLLARLAVSPYRDRLVLKGGVLLAAYDARRPTRDIDLQAQRLPNGLEDVLDMVRQTAAVPIEDGLMFDPETARARPIRDEEAYGGVRVELTGTLASARLALHVDVNVGDPVHPAPSEVVVPRLLGGALVVRGYPLPMVLAEKIVTAVQRGIANTRWRDYADLYSLSRRHDLDGTVLQEAVAVVASHRQASLLPLAEVLQGYAPLAQSRWTAWRRRQRLETHLPADFAAVLAQVTGFADPILNSPAAGSRWRANAGQWTPEQTEYRRSRGEWFGE
jgi:predicted nucleotidyltransferase component of viral defense system